MNIVICDGHRVFADALGSLLHAAGHEVVGSVVSLEEAAETCARVQVDACIVDLRPTRTGRRPDIEQAVRSAPAARAAPPPPRPPGGATPPNRGPALRPPPGPVLGGGGAGEEAPTLQQ